MAADSDLHDPSLDALMREHSTEAPSKHGFPDHPAATAGPPTSRPPISNTWQPSD